MGIRGLHPHRLSTIRDMRFKLAQHVSNNSLLAEGVVLDIGCGSGHSEIQLPHEPILLGNEVIVQIEPAHADHKHLTLCSQWLACCDHPGDNP